MKAVATSSPQLHTVSALVAVCGYIWATAGMLLAISAGSDNWVSVLGVVMVEQAFCGVLTIQRFRATQNAVLPDFLSVVLFNQSVNKTITFLALIAKNLSGDDGLANKLAFGGLNVATRYQFEAELLFLVAMVVFAGIWIWLERGRPRALYHEPPALPMWGVYVVSMALYLVFTSSSSAVQLGQIPELLHFFAIGALAVLLGGRGSYALGRPRSLLALLAMVPLLVLALRSGMKGELALVMLPVLLPVFRRLTLPRLAFLGAFVLFLLLFLFPFNRIWRDANWIEHQNIGIAETAGRVMDAWSHDGIMETAADSSVSWLKRGSSAEQGGLVMQICARDGHIGPVLIQGLATIFIPRVLWPDKPSYAPGAWFTWYLGKASSPETATSATAMMLPTELYWMFGIFGVLAGMALLSIINFSVWGALLARSGNGLIPMTALFALFARGGNLEGSTTIYAVSGPVILFVYVIGIDFIVRRIPWKHR